MYLLWEGHVSPPNSCNAAYFAVAMTVAVPVTVPYARRIMMLRDKVPVT
jgi:hypothetical protein